MTVLFLIFYSQWVTGVRDVFDCVSVDPRSSVCRRSCMFCCTQPPPPPPLRGGRLKLKMVCTESHETSRLMGSGHSSDPFHNGVLLVLLPHTIFSRKKIIGVIVYTTKSTSGAWSPSLSELSIIDVPLYVNNLKSQST